MSDPTPEDAPPLSFEAVYERLKALAHRQLGRGARGTLNTTALVHELYLRMGDVDGRFERSAQFYFYAARAMRHLLVNRARDRKRLKAGGEWMRVTLDDSAEAALAIESADQAFAIDEALAQLEASEARAARVFELRYFTGLGADEIAELIGVTRRTVDRDWRYARAFLLEAIQ